MANSFALTLGAIKPKTMVGGGIFRVRGHVLVVSDGSALVAAGEKMRFGSPVTLSALTTGTPATNIAALPNVIGLNDGIDPVSGATDTTVVAIKKALKLPNTITHIQSLGLLRLATAGAAAIAYAWEIDPLTGLLLLYGASATASQLRQSATVALGAGTYTAGFMAEGW